MLNRFGNIVKNLTVYPENMLANMEKTFGLIYSQRVLLALIDKGMSREEAYDLVQSKAMQAWEEKKSFRALIEQEEMVQARLSEAELNECFNVKQHLSQVDRIFERLGL
jgi:adenylosuccinate lyase